MLINFKNSYYISKLPIVYSTPKSILIMKSNNNTNLKSNVKGLKETGKNSFHLPLKNLFTSNLTPKIK